MRPRFPACGRCRDPGKVSNRGPRTRMPRPRGRRRAPVSAPNCQSFELLLSLFRLEGAYASGAPAALLPRELPNEREAIGQPREYKGYAGRFHLGRIKESLAKVK